MDLDEDTQDWEAEFYKTLVGTDWAETDTATTVGKDLFDSLQGSQIGLNSDGNVALMMVIEPHSVDMLIQAWNAVVDHGCTEAEEALMLWMMPQMMLFNLAAPKLKTKHHNYFPHDDEDEDDPAQG